MVKEQQTNDGESSERDSFPFQFHISGFCRIHSFVAFHLSMRNLNFFIQLHDDDYYFPSKCSNVRPLNRNAVYFAYED